MDLPIRANSKWDGDGEEEIRGWERDWKEESWKLRDVFAKAKYW